MSSASSRRNRILPIRWGKILNSDKPLDIVARILQTFRMKKKIKEHCPYIAALIAAGKVRSEKILQMRKQKLSFRVIASTMGISRQRAHQLYKRNKTY